jgi:hypothetical protein
MGNSQNKMYHVALKKKKNIGQLRKSTGITPESGILNDRNPNGLVPKTYFGIPKQTHGIPNWGIPNYRFKISNYFTLGRDYVGDECTTEMRTGVALPACWFVVVAHDSSQRTIL